MQVWSCRERDIRTAKEISAILNINLIVSELLVQRGMAGAKEAAAFLRPSLLDLHNPYLFRDMDKTIKRLRQAFTDQEKILIYGDYDVDGVTSTTLLYKVMTELGFSVVVYIPHRQEEGYGLHKAVVDKAIAAGVKLIITVDCGISARDEISYAASHGIDVIVTDHHEPPEELPTAYAIIDPKVPGENYPFRDLAGVGVAFKLVQALVTEFGDKQYQLEAEKEVLDLVALGTIADVVPLIGENRIIVKYGLEQMENTVHPGLKALLEECGLNQQIRATQIAFIVAPRINAAGRLDSAKIAIELLLSTDMEEARSLARTLGQENQLRQKTEKEILDQALAMLEGQPLPRVIVLASEGWHHGVIGIVASRLVERYNRPTFLIAIEGETGKGSARGISGYHVLEQITLCQDLLDRFGGHRQAAGFSLPVKHIERFREQLNQNALVFPEEIFYPEVKIDRHVSLEEISTDLMEDLESLAPFGFGNHSPVLGGKFPIHHINTVGKDGNHLKLLLGPQGQWVGMAFRQGEKAQMLKTGICADLAFALEWNVFQGQKSLQLQIKEIEIEPVWKHDPSVLSEIAASVDLPEFSWVDWRELKRTEWIERLQTALIGKNNSELVSTGKGYAIDANALTENRTVAAEEAQDNILQIWIWDTGTDQIIPFANYLQKCEPNLGLKLQLPESSLGLKHQGSEPSFGFKLLLPEQETVQIRLEDDVRLSSVDNFQSPDTSIDEISLICGVIIGIPLGSSELLKGLRRFADLGVNQIIWVEGKLSEEELRRRSCYFSRSELVDIYRQLVAAAERENPFVLEVAEDSPKIREAIKIFEELGLFRCQGGVSSYSLKYQPATQKLDLESSLRYRMGQELFRRAKELSELLDSIPNGKLNDIMKSNIVKGGTGNGF